MTVYNCNWWAVVVFKSIVQSFPLKYHLSPITSFISITMFCRTDNILQNIPDIPTFNMNVMNLNNDMALVGINVLFSNEKIMTICPPIEGHFTHEPRDVTMKL